MLKGKKVTLIAAMAGNRAIGFEGGMPWHLPAELKHFKETTMGKPIVMGRKTWESIGRALPGRQNIVITHSRGYRAEGCTVVQSFDEAVEATDAEEVMIIGGGQLYRQALPLADRMILTLVECEPEADTWFPEWNPNEWQEISRRTQPADENNDLAYQVLTLERSENS